MVEVAKASVKYAHWTNVEVRRLRAMHDQGRPSYRQLAEEFPRHPVKSSLDTALQLGFRRNNFQLRWLRFSHQYFAGREAEMRA